MCEWYTKSVRRPLPQAPSSCFQEGTSGAKELSLSTLVVGYLSNVVSLWLGVRFPEVRGRFPFIFQPPAPGTNHGPGAQWVLSRHVQNQAFLSLASSPEFSQFSSVQLLSHVRLFVSPWTAARQASLSITNSRSLLKLHQVSDAIQPFHPLSSPSPPAVNWAVAILYLSSTFHSPKTLRWRTCVWVQVPMWPEASPLQNLSQSGSLRP